MVEKAPFVWPDHVLSGNVAVHVMDAADGFAALSEQVAEPSFAVHTALPPPRTLPWNVKACGPPETVPIKLTDVTDHVHVKIH